MIADLRVKFNSQFAPEKYQELLSELNVRCGTEVKFRVAETPVFLPEALLAEMAEAGASMLNRLLGWPEYLDSAHALIPEGYRIAGHSAHPHFLTADFALVSAAEELQIGGTAEAGGAKSDAGQNEEGFRKLVPRLVEIQAFPSVFAYQAILNRAYSDVFAIDQTLGAFLGGLTEAGFWEMLQKTVLGTYRSENVVLLEVDPMHQKTLPDFLLMRERLGIPIVDIETLVPIGRKLHYKNELGELVPIHRIYNRAIADEMMARKIELPFRLTEDWEVEWAGHPNWYFLISKYSVPWLSKLRSGPEAVGAYVPPAVFLDDFLSGPGFEELVEAGVDLPTNAEEDPAHVIYENLLLKPLFSFAGKGISFAPSRADLLAIGASERGEYLLQQRMHFVPTIETPHGLTQAEIRILYLWPDGGELTPAISLVRLGRGKMMGVDHNRNQEWVGGSAAFWR